MSAADISVTTAALIHRAVRERLHLCYNYYGTYFLQQQGPTGPTEYEWEEYIV